MDARSFYSEYFDESVMPELIPVELGPWDLILHVKKCISDFLEKCEPEHMKGPDIFIHPEAIVEPGAIIKGPAIISANCFIGAGAYLRNGVFLAESVSIGPHCEVKESILLHSSRLAHFNFVGNSIIGSHVNFEAGAHTANHWNERKEKNIWVKVGEASIDTGLTKFGAIVGDSSCIGANAVLSPGTILAKQSIVPRLGLINQLAS